MELYYLFNSINGSYFCFDERNRPSATFNLKLAGYYDYTKVHNILNNAISPKERNRWQIVESIESPIQTKCEPCISDLDNIDSDSEIIKELTIITKAADRLKRYIEELDKKLSELDKQQNDVLHFIEKYNLNASDGFKVYKLLKDIRVERRTIKNEIHNAQMLDKTELEGINYVSLIKKMADQEKQDAYTPRILTELFELRKKGTNIDISHRDIKTGT